MTAHRWSIVRLVRNGVLAGVAGTVAMDLVWFKRYKTDGGTSGFATWEFQPRFEGFDDAPAPAKVGKILAQKVHVDLPNSAAPLTNNVIHWSTGVSWGVAAAFLRPLPGVGSVRSGVLSGVGAWVTSYAVLPKLGVYKPITEYDPKTLWKDLSAHLVFGSAVGVASLAIGSARSVARRLGA